ncbi:MAG: hypothetical protein RSE41_05100 [Clostridia bacterium]
MIDLTDGQSINVYLTTNQSLTQIYNSDSKGYVPDWSVTNMKINPEIYVSGNLTNQVNKLTSSVWTINGSTDISKYGNSLSASPYTLTLNKNMTDTSQLNIEFNGVYTNNNVDNNIKSYLTISKVENGGSILNALVYAPEGNIFKNDEIKILSASCDLYRGSKLLSDVTYQWFKYDWSAKKLSKLNTWLPLTDSEGGFSGSKSKTLYINADEVLNFETFKCEATSSELSTYSSQNSASNTISFADLSDPYFIEISAPAGNIIKNNSGEVILIVDIWRNGIKVNEGISEDKFTYNWKQFDANGNSIVFNKNLFLTPGKPENGKYLTIPASIINNKSTFICEIDENKITVSK